MPLYTPLLLVILFVNIVRLILALAISIPSDPEAEKRTDNDVSVHDLLYWAMQSAGLESVFLYIASTSSEAQFCLHTLEIISQVRSRPQCFNDGRGRSIFKFSIFTSQKL
jgi:hypothetical protein